VLPTGSFKVRGALHSLTVNLARRTIDEVVAASTGNHGAAVAWAAKAAGCRATIFLPSDPNPVKAGRIRALDARIVESGADLSAAIDAAYHYAAATGAFFLHDAADPDVPAGTATIGTEILQQLPAVDRIYVPMGDTALIRGVAAEVKHLKPATTIVGVVAASAPAYLRSWQQGEVVETDTAATIADGLAVRRPLGPNVTAIRRLVDDVQAVTEEEMLAAIRHLWGHEQIIAEPSGAAATAAWLKDRFSAAVVVVLVTGGNISPQVRARSW
jgi:threonine dehydratase